MITYLRVQNFKSWRDSPNIRLAPLTGFFGTNSSGKSSLLQMLLLLKQTVGRKEVIFFGGETSLVNLGNFREVIHAHNLEASLDLEFGCKLQEPYPIDFSMKDGFASVSNLDSFNFRTVVSEKEEKLTVEALFYISYDVRKKIVWDKYGTLDGNWNLKGATQLEDGNVKNCYGIPTSEKELENEVTWNQKFLSQFSSAFEKLFDHVYYLGPTRLPPQRHYHWEGKHPKEVDLWGNKAIDALLSARLRQLKTTNKETGVSIEKKISEWLRKMDLAHSFWLGPSGSLDDNNYEIRIQKSPNSAEVTLADMGHGLADLLPLLVHCYYVPIGSTLILEQPGVHLHPKAQADLADLLIEVIAERNLQILVESHSEHLLTRLQLRIAEQKIPANETALYFCENENGVSNIKPLEIDDLGNIKNWPKNFFGNVRGDLVKMTKEQTKRQKKAEG